MEENEKIDLKKLKEIIITKKLFIIVILIIFILLGYIYSYYYITPEYRASSTVLLTTNEQSDSNQLTQKDLTLNAGLISTYSNIIRSTKIVRSIIDELNLNIGVEELTNRINVNEIKSTQIIEISVIYNNPKDAMNIANKLVENFSKEIVNIYSLQNIRILDKAELPNTAYNINHLKDMIIFFTIGIIFAFIYIIMMYFFDRTIKDENDIKNFIGLDILGTVPVSKEHNNEIIDYDNDIYTSESLRIIRTNILYKNIGNTILITSCYSGEGKSWISANISSVLAHANKKVLLVDSDLRKGREDKIFNVENHEGLSDYISNITGDIKKDIRMANKYIKQTSINNLHIMTNGTVPPNPSELLSSSNMKNLLYLLKNMYDIVILDAAPCKLVADSIALSTMVDNTVLILESRKTKIQDIHEVKKTIESVRGNIIGTILNKKHIKAQLKTGEYYRNKINDNYKSVSFIDDVLSVERVIQDGILKIKSYNDINSIKERVKEDLNKDIEQKQFSMSEYQEVNIKQNEYLKNILDVQKRLGNIILENKLNSKRNDSIQSDIIKTIKEINAKIKELQEKNEQVIKEETSKINYKEDIENVKNKVEKVKEQYEVIIEQISEDNTEQTKRIIEEIQNKSQEILLQSGFVNQINELSATVSILKDNYLELSNLLKLNVHKNLNYSDKIINFRTLKNKRKNKTNFSIKEDIRFYDLERLATCIVPLKIDKDSSKFIQLNNIG